MIYSVVEQPPTPEVFCELRKRAGLSPKSIEAAAKALPQTVYGISIVNDDDGAVVGMGRLIGDKYLNITVVDIAVDPAHQKKGLGKLIMMKLMAYVEENVDNNCYVSLMADGEAYKLYKQFGFISTLPKSQGMYYLRP